MSRARVNKTTVESVPASDRDTYIWDDDLAGFGVKITPTGRRVYLIQYRIGSRKGRTRRVTLGTHGVLTAHQARIEAKRLLGDVQAGRDPAARRELVKQTESLGNALERFLVEHVDAKLRSSTAGEYRRLIHAHLPPTWRSRLLLDIGPADVAHLHDGLRASPYEANRVVAVLSKFYNWCQTQGLCADYPNPCRHVERFREEWRERFLSPDELQRLGAALRDAERQNTASPWVIGAIRLLILSGARRSEILSLRGRTSTSPVNSCACRSPRPAARASISTPPPSTF